jgi:hypothetical protein
MGAQAIAYTANYASVLAIACTDSRCSASGGDLSTIGPNRIALLEKLNPLQLNLLKLLTGGVPGAGWRSFPHGGRGQ